MSAVIGSGCGACKKAKVVGKRGGTYICMEGPQFPTKAESNLYRSWHGRNRHDQLARAKLARERACYVTVAMVTDYDCWHPHHDSVTVDQCSVLLKCRKACNVVREAVAVHAKKRSCKCGSLRGACDPTDRAKIPQATRND